MQGCVAAVKMGLSGVATPPGPAMFVLGDSSVDCGYNDPFNGLLHRNLSRFPCNGSDTTLLPQLLGTLSLYRIKMYIGFQELDILYSM